MVPRSPRERFHGHPARWHPENSLAGSQGWGTWLAWKPDARAGAGQG